MKISKAKLKSIILEELQEAMGVLSNDEAVNKIMGLVDQYKNDERYARYASRIPILKDAISKLLPLEDEGAFKMHLKTDYANLADMFLQTPLDTLSKKRTRFEIGPLLYYNFENAKEVLMQLKSRLEQQEDSATAPQETTPQMENKQMKITKARLKTIIMEELASVMREQEFGGTFRLPKTVNAAVDSEQWDIDYDYDAYAYGNALEDVRVKLARLGKGEPENEDDNYEYYEFSDDGDKQEVEGAFEAALIDNR